MGQRELRLQFWDVKAEVEALEAEIKPLRDKYDAMTKKYHEDVAPIIAALKKAEAPLYDLKVELGSLVRELGGNTALQPGDK